jgi:hypothetical protein
MKTNRSKAIQKALTGALFGAGILLSSPSASGAMALIYELDHRFSGATMPGPTPWAVATFMQLDENTVGLHMKANDISEGYIANWWFNFEGSLSTLNVSTISKTAGTSDPTFAYSGVNTALFSSGRDSIRWDFSFYAGTAQDFKSGDEIFVSFYSASGLDIHQFDSSIGAGGGPNLYSGANVNGLAGGTEKIVDLAPRYEDVQAPPQFVLVPEASSVFLGFLMLAGCVGGEVYRRKA